MYLFAIYIGGSHEKSLIELHDVRFSAAESIEDTYEGLRRSWWGRPETLHIDAWGVLSYADGHTISLKKAPPDPDAPHLFFVNLGGYDPCQFTELHHNIFIVAHNPQQAKIRALQTIRDWNSPHRDNQFDIECLIKIDSLIEDNEVYIHLEAADQAMPFLFTCRRIPIAS